MLTYVCSGFLFWLFRDISTTINVTSVWKAWLKPYLQKFLFHVQTSVRNVVYLVLGSTDFPKLNMSQWELFLLRSPENQVRSILKWTPKNLCKVGCTSHPFNGNWFLTSLVDRQELFSVFNLFVKLHSFQNSLYWCFQLTWGEVSYTGRGAIFCWHKLGLLCGLLMTLSSAELVLTALQSE